MRTADGRLFEALENQRDANPAEIVE